jgi:hypothetical protein
MMEDDWRPSGLLGDLLPGEVNDACCWACSGGVSARQKNLQHVLLQSSTAHQHVLLRCLHLAPDVALSWRKSFAIRLTGFI